MRANAGEKCKTRRTNTLKTPNDLSSLPDACKDLIGNREFVSQKFDQFPLPIEIFAADGTLIFANRASLEFSHIQDASLVVGKYNVLRDPVFLEIFGTENLERMARGESGFFPDLPVPNQSLVDRGVIDSKPVEAATMSMFAIPVWSGGVFLYMVCVFLPKQTYAGNPKIAQAKKYIDEHWIDAFDGNAVARAVGVSTNHLHVLFRKHVGGTVFDYYKSVKVDHIKEKLVDMNLSIAEVFHFCGVDSKGAFARIFKKLTGMTPKEYRSLLEK
jgi:AraC-like DNA-binding protein